MSEILKVGRRIINLYPYIHYINYRHQGLLTTFPLTDTHLKAEDMKVPVGSKEGMGGTAEGEGTRGSTDGEEIVKKLEDTLGGGDSHNLISNLKPQKLLQLLDVSKEEWLTPE